MNGTPDSGYYQNGLHFDSVDDHGEVYTDALSTPHESFTIETAFELSDTSDQSNTKYYWYTFNDGRDIIIMASAQEMLALIHEEDITIIPLTNLENSLLHVVIVGNGNSRKIYVNGVLGAEISYQGMVTDKFTMGGYLEPDPPYYTKTTFYTFRIYQRALTEEEINQNYEAVKASIEMEE